MHFMMLKVDGKFACNIRNTHRELLAAFMNTHRSLLTIRKQRDE
jgi:hypothetical protein